MTTIHIDDLDNPRFSEQGQSVLTARASVPIEYSMKSILKYAESVLSVPLYCDDYMYDCFERFLTEAGSNENLHAAGKGLLVGTFANALIQRSYMEELFARHPEINDIEINSPIVIAGLPRSGTSNLANIMSADTRLNSLKFWECAYPFPSPDQSPLGKSSDRESVFEQQLADWYKICPYWQNMMDVPHDGTQEEMILFTLDGIPFLEFFHADVPEFRRWFWQDADAERLYGFIQRALKALQWLRGNNQRWVLKTPVHLGFLPVIETVFKNPYFVITHRDPASSIESNATMIAYLHRECLKHPHLPGAMNNALEMTDYMVKGIVEDVPTLPEERIHQIYFHEYMADTEGTLESLYSKIRLPYTPNVKLALSNYIKSHPRGRHGRIGYNSVENFNISRDTLRDRYPNYFAKHPGLKAELQHD